MQINPNHFPFSFPSTERPSTHAPLFSNLNSSQSTLDCRPLPCTFSFHRNCHRDASKHTQNTLICNKQSTSHILSHTTRVLAAHRVLPNPRNTARASRVPIARSIASPNKHRSLFNSTSNNRLHAHVLLTFERTMRLTQALRHMYLPGIGKEVHLFIQALRTQEDQARVIQYIFKKYSKIRGGELRKDTFVHGDEDDLVGRVLRGGQGVVQAHLPGVVRGDLELHPPAADGRRQPTVVLQRDEAPRGGRSQGDFDGDARRVPSEADGTAAQGVRAQGVRGGLPTVREAGSGRVFCLLHKVLRIAAVLLPTTMNGAEAHTLRTHATRSVAVILRALPAQCVLLGDNRARPCLAMPCRRLRSPTFGFPLPITPLSHSHLLTRISRHPKNAHFSVKSNPGALIVKVRRISCSRSSPNPRSKRCAFYVSLHPTHPIPASRSYQRCCGNPARLRSDRPILLRNALLSSNNAFSSHFRFRIAFILCRTGFANL